MMIRPYHPYNITPYHTILPWLGSILPTASHTARAMAPNARYSLSLRASSLPLALARALSHSLARAVSLYVYVRARCVALSI